jgi:DNA-binding CsgD family transcriptional regulator
MDASTLIGRVYDAAGGAVSWQDALAEIARSVEGTAATLIAGPGTDKQPSIAAAVGITEESSRLYNDYYVRRDSRIREGRALGPGVLYTHERAGLTDAAWSRTEFYNDFARLADMFYMTGGVLLDDADGFAVLGIHRPRSTGDYDGRQTRLIAGLLPHLQRGVRLYNKLLAIQALERGFDAVTSGVVVASIDGHVTFANSAARALLARGAGLRESRLGLVAKTAALTSTLREAIRRTATALTASSESALVLSAEDGHDLDVSIFPLATHNRLGMRGSVIIFLSRRHDPVSLSPKILRDLFGLSGAEVRLLNSLLGGLSLQAAAQRSGVTISTARGTLKSLFRKTETSRQGELVSVVGRAAGWIRLP